MRYLIIGGTGTLGRAVIKRLYDEDPWAQIAVYSREELKQKQLKKDFPQVLFRLGDVADFEEVSRAVGDYQPEVVFHLAAIKHVEVAEENPHYTIKSNIIGTQNILDCCKSSGVEHLVFSSTDKAVLPINTYGASKMLAEQLLYHHNSLHVDPHCSVFRWGNVAASRGSVIHAFVDSLLNERKVKITDLAMTRFWIHIDDVAKFMVGNYQIANGDSPMIPDMKAAKVVDMAAAVARHLEILHYEIEEIGIRPGEKVHECLWTAHDRCIRSDTCEQFSQAELDALIKRVLS